MVSPLLPSFPVVMIDRDGDRQTVQTAEGYWQAIWEGYKVEGTFTPDRSNRHLTMEDIEPAGLIPSSPFIIAHRGGGGIVPEHTLEGYRVTAAQGFPLEPDVGFLADKALGVMHDGTVDRTTSGTGNMADFSSASFKQLVVDTDSTWGSPHPPLFDEVLAEFGNRSPLVIEAKDPNSMLALIDALERRKIRPETVIVQSFNTLECARAVQRGWTAMLLGSSNVASCVENGIQWIAPSFGSGGAGIPNSLVDQAHAAGLKVATWTIWRRWEYDLAVAAGVDAVFSDDPIHVSEKAIRTTDPFRVTPQMVYPGLQGNNGSRGKFYGNGEWGFDYTTGFLGALHGYLRPPNPDSFTLKFDLTFTGWLDASRWFSVWLGQTDYPFADNGASSDLPYLRGHHILLKGNGNVGFWTYDGTVSKKQSNTDTPSGFVPVIGTTYRVEIAVAAPNGTQTLTYKDASTGAVLGTTMTVDTANGTRAIRGIKSISFSRNGAGFKIKNVSVA